MKTAFLILAHHQPVQLADLVKTLNNDWNDIYIHIDKTSDLESFISCVDVATRPFFLKGEQRIDYKCGGFSSVKAILSLLSAAYSSGHHYGRYCLLSGADFPIRPVEDISRAFSTKTEFMRIDRRVVAGDNSSHGKALSYYYFIDQQGISGTPPGGVTEREIYSDIDLYHGSPWWALSAACVGYIIDYLQKHPQYIEFHKYTFCPEQFFFHSIVKSSPFADNLSHDVDKEPDLEKFKLSNEHGCHYIDWNSIGVELPKVLGAEDACKIYYSKALFARKFDADKSRDLLKMLDRYNSRFALSEVAESNSDFSSQEKSDTEAEKVWIVGDARSGTSWLANMVNHMEDYFFVFEPIHPWRSKEMKDVEMFSYRAPAQTDRKLGKFCNDIFSGRVFTNESTLPENTSICPDKILVKDIFAHLMVKWALGKVDGVKLIVLIRHPFAVALSKGKLGEGNWKKDPVSFLEDKDLFEEFLMPYEDVIRQAESYFEKQVTIWSIIHFVLFQQLEESDYLLMFYEDICRQPKSELARVMKYLGKSHDAADNALLSVDKVSKFSSSEGLRKRGRENYAAWKSQLSDVEYEQGMKILRVFGLDKIYANGTDPESSQVSRFINRVKVG